MSDKKRKSSKKTIGSVYISKIAVFLAIALTVTIVAMVIAMPKVVPFVRKVEAKFSWNSADVQVCDELTELQKADYGAKIGTIESESFGLNCNLYYGVNRASMRYGAGFSETKSSSDGYTYIVGYGESFFAPLHYAKTGDIIHVKTSDSDVPYKVISTGYVDSGKAERTEGAENTLVLCAKESVLSEHSGSDYCVVAVSAEEVQ